MLRQQIITEGIMLTKYSQKMPREVYSGENALENIKPIIEKNGFKKVAFFTGKDLEKSGLIDYPLQLIREAGAEVIMFDDMPREPSYIQVQEIIDQFKVLGCDFIIACGGGSVQDAAKLASILITDEYGVKELLDDPKRAKKCIPSLMIPSTAGTGAEATPNAIVGVPEKQVKIGIVNEEMIVDYVILDAVMIKKLPRKIAAATGVDALAHAIECFTGIKANPFSDVFALRALDMILNNIMDACNDPDAMEAKTQMLIAAFLAGVAITSSGTTAVHGLSYPLGGKYHIPHGDSNAILLAPVMRFNEPYCRERLAQAYDQCVHGEKTCTTDEEKSAYIINWLDDIVKGLDIPTSLSQAYGVPAEDIDFLVDAGMQQQRLLSNNMRPVTAADARMLYESIL